LDSPGSLFYGEITSTIPDQSKVFRIVVYVRNRLEDASIKTLHRVLKNALHNYLAGKLSET